MITHLLEHSIQQVEVVGHCIMGFSEACECDALRLGAFFSDEERIVYLISTGVKVCQGIWGFGWMLRVGDIGGDGGKSAWNVVILLWKSAHRHSSPFSIILIGGVSWALCGLVY
jgi:hypothetical protein